MQKFYGNMETHSQVTIHDTGKFWASYAFVLNSFSFIDLLDSFGVKSLIDSLNEICFI